MARYIDADALLEDWGIDIEPIKRRPIQMNEFRDFMRRYENHPYYFAILAIALATTADVVEIVRCRDCMHTEIDKYAPAECQNRCKLSQQYHEPTFFCKCGEPRMDLLEWIHKGDADEQSV